MAARGRRLPEIGVGWGRFLDDLGREVAHLLELVHELVHLIAHVLALQLHRLSDVLALGELDGEVEIRLGIGAGDLGDLGIELLQARSRRLRARLERLPRLLARRCECLEGPRACSMLIFMRSRSGSGNSGFMNASLAMLLSCGTDPPACPRVSSLALDRAVA